MTHAVDLLLIVLVLLGAAGGWRRGFVIGALQVAALAASLALAFWGYRYPAALLESRVAVGVWALPLAFVGSFVVARIAFGIVARRAAAALPQQAHAHRANRLAGVVPGLALGLLNAALLAVVLLVLPLGDGISTAARDSTLAGRLAAPVEWLESKLTPIFDPAVRRTLQRLTIAPQSSERIALPFRVAAPRPRPDLEARMLELVNEERAAAGLSPLRADPELAEVARAHSRDMFARGYFAHVSPEGDGPFERMRAGGVRFLSAGENLALARTLPTAHRGLMASPGHRANILRPQFGRLGVGVLDGGAHGLMVTQKFRN